MGLARFDCPECGEIEDPLLHTVNSSCGGEVGWSGGELRCERCGMSIFHFRCSECGERPSMSECTNGPTSPTRRERAQAERDEEAEREAEEEREREREEERVAEQQRRRDANRSSDAPSEAPSGDATGCAAIPGALGITALAIGAFVLFLNMFDLGSWGYPGCGCCGGVGLLMFSALGLWLRVFKR